MSGGGPGEAGSKPRESHGGATPLSFLQRRQRGALPESLTLRRPRRAGRSWVLPPVGAPATSSVCQSTDSRRSARPRSPQDTFEGQNCRAGWPGVLKFRKPSFSPKAGIRPRSLFAKRFPRGTGAASASESQPGALLAGGAVLGPGGSWSAATGTLTWGREWPRQVRMGSRSDAQAGAVSLGFQVPRGWGAWGAGCPRLVLSGRGECSRTGGLQEASAPRGRVARGGGPLHRDLGRRGPALSPRIWGY